MVWNIGVLYDIGCERRGVWFWFWFWFCKMVGLKFRLHFKHCLNEPSCINGLVVLLLQYIHIGEYVERTWNGFIVELKSNDEDTGVCGKLIYIL